MTVSRRAGLRLLAASPLAALSCARKPQAPGNRPLRLGVTPHLSMAPFYLAEEKGFFKDEGLQVTLESSSLSRDVIPLLSTGKLDAGMISYSSAIVNAILRGARIRLVAGRERLTPGCGDGAALFARKKRFPRGYDHPDSWRGVRTAVSTRSSYREFGWARIERFLSLPADSIQVQVMRIEDSIAAAMSGQLDIVSSGGRPGYRNDSFTRDFERIDILERVIPNFQYSYIAFGPTLLDAPPDVGGRLIRAYLRALRAFLSGESPRFLDRFAQEGGLDPALVKSACRNSTTPDGSLHLPDLQALLDWCLEKKYVEQTVRAESLCDLRFLAAARTEKLS
jgi:NitT/TauT family transport system substrate-binding protein